MKEGLLPLLGCPACSAAFEISAGERRGAEILDGTLTCSGCRAAFPIRGGVPRFVTPPVENRTARNFGTQWKIFDEAAEARYDRQLRDWIMPVTPAFVNGAVVLEAGCGKGRHTRLLADWGAAAVVAVDLSDAVDVAYRSVCDLPNAHVIQADILHLPLRAVFDYALSIGVLHHLPDPAAGFRAVARCIHPGGAVSAWVYGREQNGWILRFVDPVRRRVTSRLPASLLYWCSLGPSLAVYLAAMMAARVRRLRPGARLPYGDYLAYIGAFPFREIHSIVFDHLYAPVASYISREEFAGWFHTAGAQRATIAEHNRNSWRGFAVVDRPAA